MQTQANPGRSVRFRVPLATMPFLAMEHATQPMPCHAMPCHAMPAASPASALGVLGGFGGVWAAEHAIFTGTMDNWQPWRTLPSLRGSPWSLKPRCGALYERTRRLPPFNLQYTVHWLAPLLVCARPLFSSLYLMRIMYSILTLSRALSHRQLPRLSQTRLQLRYSPLITMKLCRSKLQVRQSRLTHCLGVHQIPPFST